MSFTRALSVSLILSTALTVGACKGGDKGGLNNSAPTKALKVNKVSNADIEKMFKDGNRKVQESEAETALRKLGLVEGGAADLKWDGRSGKAGNYIYTGLQAKGEDGEVASVETLEFTGVHMEGENASFDTMMARGIKIADDEATVSFDKLALSGPSPQLAAAITKAVAEGSKIDDWGDLDLDIDLDDKDIHFEAMVLEGAKVISDEGRAQLGKLAWGETDASGKGMFNLEGLSLDVQEKGKPAVKISLASANARGIDMKQFRDMSEGSKNFSGRPEQVIGKSNPFGKSFDSASFSDFDMNVESLSVHSDGGQGVATKKGSTTTIRQVLQPFTIKFSSEPQDRDLKIMYDGLQTLGYESLVFSAAQSSTFDETTDTLTVTDSFIDMEDGFRFSYDFEGQGFSAAWDDTISPEAREAALNNMKISSLNFALRDDSFLDKAFKLAAKKQGSSTGLMKMQAKGGLMFLTAMAPNQQQQEMAGQLSKAVNKFIDDGGTIQVGLKPTKPVSPSELQRMGPDADLSGLGFYAKTD